MIEQAFENVKCPCALLTSGLLMGKEMKQMSGWRKDSVDLATAWVQANAPKKWGVMFWEAPSQNQRPNKWWYELKFLSFLYSSLCQTLSWDRVSGISSGIQQTDGICPSKADRPTTPCWEIDGQLVNADRIPKALSLTLCLHRFCAAGISERQNQVPYFSVYTF